MSLFNNVPNNEIYVKISEWLINYHSTDSIIKKNKLKSRIVINMIPVVKKLARTIARRSYDPIDDLVQAGSIGLLKAIENFSCDPKDNFRVYAGYLIIGEMKHYLRDKLNCIHVPRYIQELSIRINSFTSNLTYEELQSLTSEEVASALEIPKSTVDLAMMADRRKTTLSLDSLVFADNDKLTFEDMIADTKNNNMKTDSMYAQIGLALDKIIDELPELDRIIVNLYYHKNMTQRDIAETLQINRVTVYRHLKSSMNLILKSVEKNDKLKQDIQDIMQITEDCDNELH